ncbi:MAG TPA: hypothetical protein VMF89_05995, partial [Polyangiales bacterium]|nr:hypothetical protein [Polyangiales bacterium]
MQLVLGDLGTVVTVVGINGEHVQVVGAGKQEALIFSISKGGWMTVERALKCELACDWDSARSRAEYYGCDDPGELDG